MNKTNIVEMLPIIFKEGESKAKEIINSTVVSTLEEEIVFPKFNMIKVKTDIDSSNILYKGDNLQVLESLIKEGYKEKIDLIYIDPPFLSKANYKGRIEVLNGDKKEIIEYFAYKDTWEEGLLDYLEMICVRLYLMKELLSKSGTIYIHLDYRTVHYVKIMMDYIFGEDKFLNEIIWSYKSGGVSKKHYSRKHDTILVYTKTKDYIFNPQKEKSYNRGFKPYRFKGVEEFEDELGWYTLVNLKDVWQVDMVGRTSKERVGYDTQKPERLLERIILSSSKEDSIVADFFAGSGTTGIVAEKCKRRWIMADKGDLSHVTIKKRLAETSNSVYKQKKVNIVKREVGRLIFRTILKENGLIKIELDKYILDLSKIELNKRHKEIIEEILLKDSIALIDYIGIDINYNGETPVITWQDYRRVDSLKINSSIEIPINVDSIHNPIYIRVLDVFGFESSIIVE
ncbi:site-specific DNA-methyltransferase [Tissierella sp. MSJ-40]|uniref:Site-specific DNA-methyltransferase n=1 Tax=Tissierella simiarum TaxID=2841534 RepID=A0ABS6E382_9FIRM|nr:site-specific DNA-methyltransferase [Tissierella simiarum]MBU5437371.1 site-specific DNA-methyltransferase [Tissierella simiarum]